MEEHHGARLVRQLVALVYMQFFFGTKEIYWGSGRERTCQRGHEGHVESMHLAQGFLLLRARNLGLMFYSLDEKGRKVTLTLTTIATLRQERWQLGRNKDAKRCAGSGAHPEGPSIISLIQEQNSTPVRPVTKKSRAEYGPDRIHATCQRS
eukprot:scaffold164106_cov14-Tisochrysis_lutea.AAC.2